MPVLGFDATGASVGKRIMASPGRLPMSHQLAGGNDASWACDDAVKANSATSRNRERSKFQVLLLDDALLSDGWRGGIRPACREPR